MLFCGQKHEENLTSIRNPNKKKEKKLETGQTKDQIIDQTIENQKEEQKSKEQGRGEIPNLDPSQAMIWSLQPKVDYLVQSERKSRRIGQNLLY